MVGPARLSAVRVGALPGTPGGALAFAQVPVGNCLPLVSVRTMTAATRAVH